MVFNTLSPNFVIGPILPILPRTQIQTRAQSRERRKVVTCKFNMEAGHEKKDSTPSFYSYQSQHGNTSIIQVMTSETSTFSLIHSVHPSPPVVSISEISSIECSEFKYINKQDETQSLDDDELTEAKQQIVAAKQAEYEAYLVQ